MNIYLCARYSRQGEMRELRTQLETLGYNVGSRWLDCPWTETDSNSSSAAPAWAVEEWAIKDMEDVVSSDCLIAFADPPNSGGRGGRHVEFGMALALGKQLIVVGRRENLFHHHPGVKFCPDKDSLFQLLRNADFSDAERR